MSLLLPLFHPWITFYLFDLSLTIEINSSYLVTFGNTDTIPILYSNLPILMTRSDADAPVRLDQQTDISGRECRAGAGSRPRHHHREVLLFFIRLLPRNEGTWLKLLHRADLGLGHTLACSGGVR